MPPLKFSRADVVMAATLALKGSNLAVKGMVLAIGATACLPAAAQCAMCGLSNNGAASRSAFFHGALVLLVPVGVILGGIAVLTWKLRDANTANDAGLQDPDPGSPPAEDSGGRPIRSIPATRD